MGGFCYAQQKQHKLEKDSLVWTKNDYFEQMVKRDNAMRLETENGKNISKLNEWSELILKELEEGSTKEK